MSFVRQIFIECTAIMASILHVNANSQIFKNSGAGIQHSITNIKIVDSFGDPDISPLPF
jgi:hypothetical protein